MTDYNLQTELALALPVAASRSNGHGALATLNPTATLNNGLCVHDWYQMPEAYSEPLIIEAMQRFGIRSGDTVLDPFSGTGTTVAAACLNGVNGVGLEVNPFLYFAACVKMDWAVDLGEFKQAMSRILNEAEPLLASLSISSDLFNAFLLPAVADQAAKLLTDLAEPDMPRLHQWMTPVVVRKVLILRELIRTLVPERLRGHFLLALGAILRPVSNMKLTPHAFGSQVRKEDAPVYDLFALKIAKIFKDLVSLQERSAPPGQSEIFHCDARAAQSISSHLLPASLAVTSPPYLNNLDYTMQTRLELFFLQFVNDMTDLRTLRKAMVTCDAKAMYKDVKDSAVVQEVANIQEIAERLRVVHAGKNWGWDYAYMTTQYFGGMARVLAAVQPLLRQDARFVLIVGESAHSGVKIPVPELLGELGERIGYRLEEINVLRRRRSSSHTYELCESEVILQKL